MELDTACHEDTLRDKRTPYEQYYFGQKNKINQRNGDGENHWTGPESLESYSGSFVQDMMHGEGEYRWRFKDPDGAFVTYEGRFYANKMHGYGVMSYPDGKVFTGLYYNNVRWGPGVENATALTSNVGLWRGTQLARLSWSPPPRSVAPDLSTGPEGPAYLNRFRKVLTEHVQTIGETNSALDLMKEQGRDPVRAHIIWPKLYPMTCNDPNSALFHKNLFDYKYYRSHKCSLEERSPAAYFTAAHQDSQTDNVTEYYAWNNNDMIIHMMKHAYQHDRQRAKVQFGLTNILNGPRKRFRPAGKHEMDCRTVLMASYLGHVANVAQLVNEADVYADIADIRGNTALMYAVCGNHPKIIGFLVDAGANVNSCNDSCCTPLGVALLRYITVANDIGGNKLLQAVLPHVDKEALKTAVALTKTTQAVVGVMEWNISRELQPIQGPGPAGKKIESGISKLKRGGSSRSSLSKRRSESVFKSREFDRTYDSDDKTGAEPKMVGIFMKGQYCKFVTEIYQPIHGQPDPEYLFSVNENFLATDSAIKSHAMDRTHEKPANIDPMKSQLLWENNMVDGSSLDSAAKHKHDTLTEIQLTIMDLLARGADPKLVICPQPAVLLALKTRNPDIVKQMVAYGADINQQFPDLYNFTVLDMVVTDEYICADNLEMMRALLKLGADTSHRVPVPTEQSSNTPSLVSDDRKTYEEGPTLLHIVLMKRCEYEGEDEIVEKMIQLLISYHCDPTAHYKGSSAIETTMMFKFHLLHIFIKNPKTNLNGIINSRNQTILMKLFSKDFFREITQSQMIPTLTNLLLYGADPLLEGQDGDKLYGNVFEFATKTYGEMRAAVLAKAAKQAESKPGAKPAKGKTAPASTSQKPKGMEAECIEYGESLELMTECARLLHIRWIQGKLARELIDNIHKFFYRPWCTIIRGYYSGYVLGLWVSTLRCLEIWDILKTTRKKKYNDPEILRKYVSVVQFYVKRVRAKVDVNKQLTAAEANIVDTDVKYLLEEHNISSKLSTEASAWKMLYVKPELDMAGEHKFHVCFQCALRLKENYFTCEFCSLVSFCNMQCLKENIERAANHPCNDFLAEKYLPLPEEMSLQDSSIIL